MRLSISLKNVIARLQRIKTRKVESYTIFRSKVHLIPEHSLFVHSSGGQGWSPGAAGPPPKMCQEDCLSINKSIVDYRLERPVNLHDRANLSISEPLPLS
jgi:hypothetical protein